MSDSKKNIINFLILFVLIFFIFFQKITGFFLNSLIITYSDEIMTLLFSIFVAIKTIKTRRINKNHALLFSSVIFLISISLVNKNAPLYKIILQTFIHLKLFFFYYLFEIIFEKKPLLAKKTLNVVIFITILGLFVSFSLQQNFTTFFNLNTIYRYGFVRAYGFQLEVNHVAVTLSLYFLYFFFIINNKPDLKKFFLYSVIFLSLTFFTGSRSVLVVIPIAFLFIFKSKRNFYIKYFLIILAFLSISLSYLLLKDTEFYKITARNFQDTVDMENSSYIRGIMIYYGIELAVDNFPIGTGAASFGTVLSEGSPVYSKLGLDKMDFFIEMTGIYDSNIASILGEFGFLGLALFIYLFFMIYKNIEKKISDTDSPEYHKRYYQSILILVLFYSASMGIIMNSYNGALFALFINLLPSCNKQEHT